MKSDQMLTSSILVISDSLKASAVGPCVIQIMYMNIQCITLAIVTLLGPLGDIYRQQEITHTVPRPLVEPPPTGELNPKDNIGRATPIPG